MDVNSRILFFDDSGLNKSKRDAINNYSKVSGANSIFRKGDIIHKLQANAHKYKLIVIAGHGDKNEISTGAGMGGTNYKYDATKEINLTKFSDSETFFTKYLTDFFDRSSSIPILFLAGCNIVDETDPKESLPQRISMVVKDVLIIAPTTYIKPKIGKKELNMKFEVKPGLVSEFEFYFTLGAYLNGEKIEAMDIVV